MEHRKRKLPLSIIVAAAVLLSYILLSLGLNLYIDGQRRKIYDRHYESLAMDAVGRTISQLNYRINLYEVELSSVAFNEELYNQLMNDYPDFISQWEAARRIEFSYQYVHSLLPGISQFRIYHNNPSFLENGGMLWKPGDRLLDGETEKAWYLRRLNTNVLEWAVNLENYRGEPYAVLTGNIPRGAASSVGVLYLRVSCSQAFGSVLKSVSYAGTVHALADLQGQIFLSTDNQLVGKTLEETVFGSLETSRVDAYREDASLMRAENGYHILNRISNGWRLYSYVPLSGITRDLERLNRMHGVGVLVILALGLIAALSIFHYYRTRLKRLNRRLVSDVPAISLPPSLQTSLTDHVDQVEAYYERMVRRMKDLKSREMEEAIRAMESYLNPHFLYNTLGLIRWRALDDGDEELCSLVDDMTTYYRLSLSGGRSVVTVSDEITHLQAYVAIQQRRWGEMVQVVYDIDNSALDAYTPKNILQTIVENCYVHGLVPSRKDHLIRIAVKKEGGHLSFTVEDNGMGIEPEKLESLNRDDDSGGSGIGIRSVRQRLRLYFGKNAVLQLTSEMGKGTRVLIRIPFCRQEPTVIGGEQDVHGAGL